jgi:hypothetical protein
VANDHESLNLVPTYMGDVVERLVNGYFFLLQRVLDERQAFVLLSCCNEFGCMFQGNFSHDVNVLLSYYLHCSHMLFTLLLYVARALHHFEY